MATHSSILAWEIPWTEEPGWLQSMGSKKSDTTEQLTLSLGGGEPSGRGDKPRARMSVVQLPTRGKAAGELVLEKKWQRYWVGAAGGGGQQAG